MLTVTWGRGVAQKVGFFVQTSLEILVHMGMNVRSAIASDARKLVMVRQAITEAFGLPYVYRLPTSWCRLFGKDVIAPYVGPTFAYGMNLVFIFAAGRACPCTLAARSHPRPPFYKNACWNQMFALTH